MNIAICGWGTVGRALYQLIEQLENSPLTVTHIVARSGLKGDQIADGIQVLENIEDLYPHLESIDLVCELIGGIDTAGQLTQRALTADCHVVSANKALYAEAGDALRQLAQRKQLAIGIEAAVTAAIPIIASLSTAWPAERYQKITGLLNGTCNYMLTLQSQGKDYSEALALAQRNGFAEADPTLDVSGVDAAHKAVILAAIAMDTPLSLDNVSIEGLPTTLAGIDFERAASFGYTIKHISQVQRTESADVQISCFPCLIEQTSQLANVWYETNAIEIQGQHVPCSLLSGPGAGGNPTATAVLADLVRISNVGVHGAPWLQSSSRSSTVTKAASSYRRYLRVELVNRPGSVSMLTDTLGKHKVNIDAMVQMESHDRPTRSVELIVDACTDDENEQLRANISALQVSVDDSYLSLRILAN